MRIFLVLLVIAGSASADPPRYPRKQNLVIDVKPLPQRAKPAPARPTVTGDDILAAEERAEPIRAEQEQILERLATETPDNDAEKPEILFRLADPSPRPSASQLRLWQLRSIKLELQAR